MMNPRFQIALEPGPDAQDLLSTLVQIPQIAGDVLL